MLLFIIFIVLFVGAVFVVPEWISSSSSDKQLTVKIAAYRSIAVVLIAIIFGAAMWLLNDRDDAILYFSGYFLEKALSVDNLIAFTAVFAYFQLPKQYEPKILNTGIISAVVFRLIFTLFGVGLWALIGRPMEFVFALIVGYSATKMAFFSGDGGGELVDHNQRWYIKFLKGKVSVTGDASQSRFFLTQKLGMVRAATPLFLALIAIEVTDIVFSFDSVPTIIAVAQKPIIIYPAMMFAIVGLRSMYFLLASLQKVLSKLNIAVTFVLFFIALKLMLHAMVDMSIGPLMTLAVVFVILGWGVIASLQDSRSKVIQGSHPGS